ncbi:CHAD domain-containing protein [Asticcacaulis sp.]|uniref:CHAD domain-containing protein n=1 Tax=Asticcacaulis sp. TaxID=1872648 RepID=UPI003F7C68E1
MTRKTEHTALSTTFDRLLHQEINLLMAPDAEPGETSTVHTVRAGTKKIRACLRLVRGSLDRLTFDKANTLFRDSAKSLRAYRDNEVISEVITYLNETGATEFDAGEMDGLREILAASPLPTGCDDALATVRNNIQARRTALHLASLKIKKSDLTKAMRRTYRRNRNAFANVVRDPSGINLHEWRKQIKVLEYQLHDLNTIWPKPMDGTEEDARHLAQILGHIQDLTLLRKRLKQIRPIPEASPADRLLTTARRQRRKLRNEAIRLGHALYARSSDDFAADVNRHWKAWRQMPPEQPLIPAGRGRTRKAPAPHLH